MSGHANLAPRLGTTLYGARVTTPQDAPQADGSVWMARRLLAAALMAALVMVGVALVYVIGVEDYPPA